MSAAPSLPGDIPVAIVGAGQAGLSLSWFLRRHGIEHVVLERHVPVHSWREERWDSFCLVTPNWQCTLPGYPYAGPDPNGFLVKREIVDYLQGFIASFDPPVISNVEVRALAPDGAGYRLETSAGPVRAGQVVVATGGYHTPIIPDEAALLPAGILQLNAAEYRNSGQLPPGRVLVVGSGQSGAQIAEDLLLDGRDVHLAVGPAPRVSRFYRGRDVVEWLQLMGFYDMPVDKHPLREGVRDNTNHYVSGRDGGRDIDLRRHALAGMRLHGRLLGLEGAVARFGDDLAANLDAADATNASIKRSIDEWIAREGIEAPTEAPYTPPWVPTVPLAETALRLDLAEAGVSAVVWCIGFRADFGWIDAPVLDDRGRPRHVRGVTDTPGVYFLGLPWMHTWGSGRMSGVARDAEYLAERILEHGAAAGM